MAAPYLYSPDDLPDNDYRRVVSLVPSLSESLAGLHLADRLVGRTKFCTSSPETLGDIPTIGGTKNPNLEQIRMLAPDLILTVKEENTLQDAEALAQTIPTVVFDIKTVADAAECLEQLGRIFRLPYAETAAHVSDIHNLLNPLPEPHPKVLYLIWKSPWMTVGPDTYIADMLAHCGFQLPDKSLTRYPEVDLPSFIRDTGTQAVFLSSEPYPFKQQHAESLSEKLGIHVLLIDGQLMSWYGTLTPAGLRYGRALREQLLERLDQPFLQ